MKDEFSAAKKGLTIDKMIESQSAHLRSNEKRLRTAMAVEAGHQVTLLQRLFSGLPLFSTLSLILSSLGEINSGKAIKPLWIDTLPRNEAGHLYPFSLSESGQRFFCELLHLENIELSAGLLVFKDGKKRKIPLGILIEEPKQRKTYFFDLTTLFSDQVGMAGLSRKTENFRTEAVRHIFVGNESVAETVELQRVRTNWQNPALQRKLEADYRFGASFELLTINKKAIFSHADASSSDFQEAFCQIASEIKDKMVVEIGSGAGINAFLAARFGARSYCGNEINWPAILLFHWNQFFVQETGQLAGGSTPLEVFQRSGLDGLPRADVYVFNTPAIVEDWYVRQMSESHGKGLACNIFISIEQFQALFFGLKKRLRSRDLLILRILVNLITDNKDFPEPQKSTLVRTGLKLPDQRHAVKLVARAMEFLERQPDINFEQQGCNRDLFLIRKKQ